jgi:hypothetical protein
MVLAFLRAEIDSPRFGAVYQSILAQTGKRRSILIDHADLSKKGDNAERIELLAQVRGYKTNRYLFVGFPDDVAWTRATVDLAELGKMKYANYPAWIMLSHGSRLVGDGASNLETIEAPENVNSNIRAVAQRIKNGDRFPELIVVEGGPEDIVIAEGHTRATAYVVAVFQEPVEILVGRSDQMNAWRYY